MTTPVEEFLAEQRRLQTPVARIAERPAQGGEGRFTELIPLTQPEPGRQYAFEVDLDRCTGCKACVAACHALNGLDEHETWRDVGSVVGVAEAEAEFVQAVTTSCHHCEDPGCLNGCPVLAYEKDPATGIVHHLDDQCIGCSYCIMKCPYDAPKFNRRRGIVRKCDLCASRLAHHEAPACVQACPTEAIRVVTVARGRRADEGDFLAAAPDPSLTRPTTRYVSSRAGVRWRADSGSAPLAPEPAHWPLVVLTTLAGLGTGCTALAAADGSAAWVPTLWRIGCGAGLLGLLASVAHLGQPLRAWRIFLGLRRSWMSREALLLGLWAAGALAIAFAGADVPADRFWAGFVAALGAAGLFSSLMVYSDTPRALWNWRHGAPRFLGGAALLACGTVLAIAPAAGLAFRWALPIVLLGKCAAELTVFGSASSSERAARRSSASLLLGPLRPWFGLRYGAAALGVPLVVFGPPGARAAGCALILAGEVLERMLFFRAAGAPRMPGVPPP